jgi:hypothetical protein
LAGFIFPASTEYKWTFCKLALPVFLRGIRASQGDQIGRILAHWLIVTTTQLFVRNYRNSPNVGLLFSTVKLSHRFGQKMVWATLWVIFFPPKTHLVTLCPLMQKKMAAEEVIIKLKPLQGDQMFFWGEKYMCPKLCLNP